MSPGLGENKSFKELVKGAGQIPWKRAEFRWETVFSFTITFTITFSVFGPLVWNGLPLALRSLPREFSLKFFQQLKTTLIGRAGVGHASE